MINLFESPENDYKVFFRTEEDDSNAKFLERILSRNIELLETFQYSNVKWELEDALDIYQWIAKKPVTVRQSDGWYIYYTTFDEICWALEIDPFKIRSAIFKSDRYLSLKKLKRRLLELPHKKWKRGQG